MVRYSNIGECYVELLFSLGDCLKNGKDFWLPLKLKILILLTCLLRYDDWLKLFVVESRIKNLRSGPGTGLQLMQQYAPAVLVILFIHK